MDRSFVIVNFDRKKYIEGNETSFVENNKNRNGIRVNMKVKDRRNAKA